MASKQSNINKKLLYKLAIMMIPSGSLVLVLFLLLILVFRLSNLQFIPEFYILGLLSFFMLSIGLLAFLKYKSYGDENSSALTKRPAIKRDFLTRVGISQILFGLALIIIVHNLISIIVGLVVISLAAYFLFFRK
ncbi:MAG: hypothetical protein ACYDDR_14145 [Acidithiobacillus ferrivorans]